MTPHANSSRAHSRVSSTCTTTTSASNAAPSSGSSARGCGSSPASPSSTCGAASTTRCGRCSTWWGTAPTYPRCASPTAGFTSYPRPTRETRRYPQHARTRADARSSRVSRWTNTLLDPPLCYRACSEPGSLTADCRYTQEARALAPPGLCGSVFGNAVTELQYTEFYWGGGQRTGMVHRAYRSVTHAYTHPIQRHCSTRFSRAPFPPSAQSTFGPASYRYCLGTTPSPRVDLCLAPSRRSSSTVSAV